jgi:hypothetical protein
MSLRRRKIRGAVIPDNKPKLDIPKEIKEAVDNNTIEIVDIETEKEEEQLKQETRKAMKGYTRFYKE